MLGATLGLAPAPLARTLQRMVRFHVLIPTDVSDPTHWSVEVPDRLGRPSYRSIRSVELAKEAAAS